MEKNYLTVVKDDFTILDSYRNNTRKRKTDD